MMKILLTTLHSRYSHASLALPSLAASLTEVEGVETVIRELTINEAEESLFEALSEAGAEVIAFSCYIWNIEKTLILCERLKKEAGCSFIVLGGPEVSFEAEAILESHPSVDCIVRGEGETVFRELVLSLKEERNIDEVKSVSFRREGEIICNPADPMIADLDSIPSPFEAGLIDTSKPLVYFETSRGCPFSCAFCLSSLEAKVRAYSLGRVKRDLSRLMMEEVKTVKLVDRTFNFNPKRADEIWAFILEHNRSSRFHFEIAADLLTDENIEVLKRVPKDAFRFEIGVQSIAEETLHEVGRQSEMTKLFYNVKRLLEETEILLHLDLVAGLPGENMTGFLASLERVFQTGAHHIQVEPLKVLKGAPMEEIAKREGYGWSSHPPYRIITTPWLDADEVERIETMGRLLELVYNSGRFKESLNQVAEVMPLSQFLSGLADFWQKEDISTLPLVALFEVLWRYAGQVLEDKPLALFCDALTFDHCRALYPAPKRLPSYFHSYCGATGRVSKREIVQLRTDLGLPSGRIRAFVWSFGKDYADSGKERETDLLFLYCSMPGEKEKVEIRRIGPGLLLNSRQSAIN